MAGRHVASVSFADDVALVGRSRTEVQTLVRAYLRWCSLLGLKVTKVQAWANSGVGQELQMDNLLLRTGPTFKIVGVTLGEDAVVASQMHFTPRLKAAMQTLQRLRTLDAPSAVCSLLWRTDVLPRALYGCEVCDSSVEKLVPLSSGGKAALGPKFPLRINEWRAPEVLMGLPFGESMVRDPVLEMRERQLRWLQLVYNMPGLVGETHRSVAWQGNRWCEPSKAFKSALRSVDWTVRRNTASCQIQTWPILSQEKGYPGDVVLVPEDTFPMVGAVFTDGSICLQGGAAAVQEEEEAVRTARVAMPRSSTHCELIGLALGLQLRPPQILSDSLAALTMVKQWSNWPTRKILCSPDRVEVRLIIDKARQLEAAPALGKVKAHDRQALELRHPRAVGNDLADSWAKRAATDDGHTLWQSNHAYYGDAVEILGADGTPILVIQQTLAAAWWSRRRQSRARSREWLELLYPAEVEFDWSVSTGIFRRPTVNGGAFIHPVAPAVIKWLARVRAGCLASRSRLVRHGMVAGTTQCLCCGAAVEDDKHIVSDCPSTGTRDWLLMLTEAWGTAQQGSGLQVPLPAVTLLEPIRLPLLAALIPSHAAETWGLPPMQASRFLSLFHRGLAEVMAERLRRRGELMSLAQTSSPTEQASEDPVVQRDIPSLPLERRLSVADLRNLERQRPPNGEPRVLPSSSPRNTAPPAGEPRRRWLRKRLLALIKDDMVMCPCLQGSSALVVLELFERLTREPFSDTPGALLDSRLRGMAKVLGNIAREETWDPPLENVRTRGGALWNRTPQLPHDAIAWRRTVEEAEAHCLPVLRLKDQMAAADAGLVAWIQEHRYLTPTAVENGESGMALLILWEVDHQQPYPGHGGEGLSGALAGFTRRLQERVAHDSELQEWLECKYMQVPLSAGLAPSHHHRWSVRVCAPPSDEPQGWYTEFVSRWRAYLEILAQPRGSRPTTAVPSGQVARIHPVGKPTTTTGPQPQQSTVSVRDGRKRPREDPTTALPTNRSGDPTAASSSSAVIRQASHAQQHQHLLDKDQAAAPPQKRLRKPQTRKRPRTSSPTAPTATRQCSIRQWALPVPPQSAVEDVPTMGSRSLQPRHGRAVEGPPT